jgi:cell division protein FtsA
VEDIIVGIDIGTTKVCTLIGRIDKTGQLQVLGKGFTPFNGVKKGVIVDIEDTSKAIR